MAYGGGAMAVVLMVGLAGIFFHGFAAGTSIPSSTASSQPSSSNEPVAEQAQSSSYSIADSALAEGVDSNYQPVNRTQAFDASDTQAYSWIKLVNVDSPAHNMTWVWLTPWGQVYFRSSASIPDPGIGKFYPVWYEYAYINIKGSNAMYLSGNWQVNVFMDGALVLVQNFTLESPYITPQGVRTAYDVAPLIQSGYTGKGVTVAIIDPGMTSNLYSDVQGFDTAFGLTDVNITVAYPNGAQGTNADSTGETTGDVELVHAMAPDAHILLVLVGSNASTMTGLTYVIDNNAADVVTRSGYWYLYGQGNLATIRAENSELAKGVGENVTLIASSGDSGSNNTVPFRSTGEDVWATYLPDSWLMPAYSPYFTAVGGTALTVINGQYGSEVGWNQSGGGPSNIFTEPSWQTGIGVPKNGYRNVPDISLDASPATGYSFFWNGSLGYFWGTSGAAPTFAGIVADIIQAAGHRVGFLNPTLYALASSDPSTFHDVTAGCSLVKTDSEVGTGYCASPGWDYVTGLGSPDAVALLDGIAHVQVVTTTNTTSATTTSTTSNSTTSTISSSTTTTTPVPEFPTQALVPTLLVSMILTTSLVALSRRTAREAR